jgi:BatD DUF11 like domain
LVIPAPVKSIAMSSTTFKALIVLLASLLGTVHSAIAGDATFRAPPREGYVGVPSLLRVEIRDAANFDPPVFPEVDGLTFALGQSQHKQTSVTIINGRSAQTVTQVVEIEITPSREGTFSVPPIVMTVDGKTFQSNAFKLVVKPSDATGILLAEIAADPPEPFVGQPTRLSLKIFFKPYRDPSVNVVLRGGDMWSLIDVERSEWGPFRSALIKLEQRRQRPADRERVRDDTTYSVFEIEDVWTPTQAGPPQFGSVEISASWPTGAQVVRDFFGQNSAQLTGTRPIRALAKAEGITVRPLPEEDRPASFAGAVGDFTVSASARPTEVSVGDPITVIFTVKIADRDPRSLGSLETLQAPPFANLPALTSGFRIPSDQLGGTVRDREKSFTQTFRPLSADVTEIPPIPFGFFDPEAGTYREVLTDAIPIAVRAAERMTMSEIVGGTTGPVASERGALTTVAGGLLANAPPSIALLANARATIGPVVAGAVALPPFLCAILLVMRRVQERRDANPLRIRAGRALAVAHRSLSAVKPGQEAEAVLHAVTGFIADRCGLYEGAKTRGDAMRALELAMVEPELLRRVDTLLASCERARYAPAGASGISIEEAKAVLRLLERAKLGPHPSAVGGAS